MNFIQTNNSIIQLITLKMKKPIHLYFVIFSLMFSTGCSKYYKIYCGDTKDSVRLIAKKNPFEYSIKETDKNINLTVGVLSKLADNASLSAAEKQAIRQQIEDLNQFNITYNQTLRAAYEAVRVRPCDDEVFRKYFQLVEKLDSDRIGLENMRISVQRIAETKGLGGGSVKEVVSIVQSFLHQNEK